MKLRIFTADDLQPIITEGTAGFATPAAWVLTFARNSAAVVKASPGAYLSFGPFWWPLKAIMQREGFIGGEPVDPALVEQVSMGSDILNVAAAYAFQEEGASGNTFTMLDEFDGMVDLVAIDEEMEG